MNYTVYQVTAGDERKYIGCTTNWRERIQCHLKRAKYPVEFSDAPLYQAFLKSGILDFQKLAECRSRKVAFDTERKLIEKFNTLAPNGFNRSRTGRGNTIGSRHRKVRDQFGNVYSSLGEAAERIGVNKSAIWDVLTHRKNRSQVRGFQLTYVDRKGLTRRAV